MFIGTPGKDVYITFKQNPVFSIIVPLLPFHDFYRRLLMETGGHGERVMFLFLC